MSGHYEIGEVLLIGRFHGATSAHWQAIGYANDGRTIFRRVKSVSFRNDDGTFSSRWEAA